MEFSYKLNTYDKKQKSNLMKGHMDLSYEKEDATMKRKKNETT